MARGVTVRSVGGMPDLMRTAAAPPALTPVGTAELGMKADYSMNVNVAVDDRYVYATHSYVPVAQPKKFEGTGDLVVLDRATLAEVARVPAGIGPFRVAVDRLRRRAYVLAHAVPDLSKAMVSIVDTDTLTVVGELAGVQWGSMDVAVDSVAGRVYVLNYVSGKLAVHDTTTHALVRSIDVGKQCMAMTADEATGRVYIVQTTVDNNSLVIADPAAGKLVQRVLLDTTNTVVQDVAADPARDAVYVISQGNSQVGQTGPSVFVYTPSTGAVRVFPLTSVGRTVEVDPVIGQLYTAGENHVEAVDPIAGAIIEQAKFPGHPGRMGLDGETGLLYVGENATGRVVAYRSILQHPPPPAPPPTLSFAGNGGRFTLFRQAADGTVETATWREDQDWTPFQPIGRAFPPGTKFASLSPAPGRWWLFGVDEVGILWGTGGEGHTAGTWHQIGTGFVPGAEIAWAAPFPGRIFLYAADATGTIRSFGWSDAGPEGEGVHGGITVAPGAPIAAVSRKEFHWDLFVLHPDGHVYTQWWSTDEDDFSPWGAVPGPTVFAPGTRISAIGRKTDQLDLFAVRPDGWVVSTFWNNEHEWDGHWRTVSDGWGFPAGAPVAVTNENPNNLHLVAAAVDSQLWQTYWHKDDGWANWVPLTGPVPATGGTAPGTAAGPGAAVVLIRRGPDEVDVCWLAPGDQVGHGWANRHQRGWSTQLGVTRPVGTRSTYHAQRISTGFPVRGDVRITLWEDGSWLVRGHMHGSGFDPYEFVLSASVPIVRHGVDVTSHSTFRAGRVDGWEPFGDEDRNYDWSEAGWNIGVGADVTQLLLGTDRRLVVSKTVKNDGIGGALQSLVDDVIEGHLLRDVIHTVGGTLVVALALGREMTDLFGVDLGDNGWLGFSILTVANQYWLVIPLADVVLPMIVGSDDPSIGGRGRSMTFDEYKWASAVFGATLPHFENIKITNLVNPKNDPFTSKSGDTYYVHMGDKAFDSPQTDVDTGPDGTPTEPGQVFIHELTHVWDAAHSGPAWELEALGAQLNPPDGLPDGTPTWSKLGIEHKAMVIAEWYRLHHANLESQPAQTHPYFPYVRDHLRKDAN